MSMVDVGNGIVRLARYRSGRAQPKANPKPTRDQAIIEALTDIKRRLDRNVPNRRDPEAFHVEKSDISDRLHAVLTALSTGRPLR